MTWYTPFQTFLSQLNATTLITIITVIGILGCIAEFIGYHADIWKYVCRVIYGGGFLVGLATLISTTL